MNLNGDVGNMARSVASPEAPAAAIAPPAGEVGLTSAAALARLGEYGPNVFVPERRRSRLVAWLLRPLADPMAILLLVAGGTYLALGDRLDALIVLLALVPITLVTIVLERRSERALERLRRLTAPTATVWRDGARRVVPTETLVPGDAFFVREGDVIPADAILISSTQLMVDESALTGESQPVDKEPAGDEAGRGLYAGTTVLSGRGIGRVTETGPRTRYGRVGTLVAGIKPPATPLEHAIRVFVVQLGLLAAGFCAVVAALQLARGAGWAAAIIAGVSLAIAAVPEVFPMVYTLYLSLGAWRLARQKALVRRLPSVETLGSTTVICADKTGTLTLGRLEMTGGASAAGGVFRARDRLDAEARRLIEAAVLASEPHPFDVLEQAIVQFAQAQGIDVPALHAGTLVRDHPFEQEHRYMSHVWQRDGELRTYAKGALEGIVRHADAPLEMRQRILAANERLAAEGMRVIAVAEGTPTEGSAHREGDERGLRLLGLVAFTDPVRPGVPEALAACGDAGIRVIMITGDHPVTAHAVADALGLPHEHGRHLATGEQLDVADDDALAQLAAHVAIFARIRPEQKYRIVRALRAQGHVVAMTGDGINDAPALREADIGVALGERGTEVAREAATLVLLDDNFATIVNAVRNGRRIFDNLLRAFSYLVAFHMPLLVAALAVPVVGAPLLLLPMHLVWLELVVHPTASLVFEGDPGTEDLMRRPPRPPARGLLAGIGPLWSVAEGLVLGAGVVALYLWWIGQGVVVPEGRAIAIAALVVGQMGLVLVERSPSRPVWRTGLAGNPTLVPVLAATLASLLAALYVPTLAAVLKLAPLGLREWAVALVTALVALLVLEPFKYWRRRSTRRRS